MRSLFLLGDALDGDGRSIRLVRSLANRGEVDVLCLDARSGSPIGFGDGVRIHAMPAYDFRPRGILYRLRPHRRFDRFEAAAPPGHFDLVVAVDLPTLRPGARLAASRGARLLYEVREPWPFALRHTFRPASALLRALLPLALWSALRAGRRDERSLLSSVDLTVSAGREAADWLLENHDLDHVLVIEDLPPLRKQVAPGSLREDLGIPVSDRVVMCLGPLSRGRDLGRLLRAAEQFPAGVHLVFAGRGRQESRLRLLADAPGLRDRVHFAGPIPAKDRPAAAAAADLGVAFGGRPASAAIYSFLAAGVPVLITEEAGPGATIREHDAGRVVVANRASEIAAAIHESLADHARMACQGANGRRAHLGKLHWEAEEERLLSAIDALGPPRLS